VLRAVAKRCVAEKALTLCVAFVEEFVGKEWLGVERLVEAQM
jgi:hypothetical protein